MTQTRGERYQEQFNSKLKKWKQIDKEQQFKALPLPAHRAPLFVPKKSTKPLTCSATIALQTDKRAEEWEHFEQERRQKELFLDEIKAAKTREDEVTLKLATQRVLIVIAYSFGRPQGQQSRRFYEIRQKKIGVNTLFYLV